MSCKSTGLIAMGTGCISCAMPIIALLGSRNWYEKDMNGVALITSTLAAGALGLIASHLCKEEDESLTRRDVVLLAGAALAGAFAGLATVATVRAVVEGILVGAVVYSAVTSLIFLPFRILLLPLEALSAALARRTGGHLFLVS